MWKSPVRRIDPITQLVGAAISSSLLRHHLFARESELLSEALSWMILPAIHYYWGSSRVRSGSRATVSGPLEHAPASGVSLWAAALAVSSASLYQAEYGIIAFFASIQSAVGCSASIHRTRRDSGGIKSCIGPRPSLDHSFYCCALYNYADQLGFPSQCAVGDPSGGTAGYLPRLDAADQVWREPFTP